MKIEQDLIEACIRGDRGAHRRLYDQLFPYLNAVCLRYLNNSSDQNDALQDSFMNLFRSLKNYDASRSEFHTWATRITINCTLKLNQRMYKVRSEELPENDGSINHLPCVLETLDGQDLVNYLKRMPESYLEVFNLHAVEGYSHKEISKMLGIKENLSKQRHARAKKWIKARLTQDGDIADRMEDRV